MPSRATQISSTLRPWNQFFDTSTLTLPSSYSESMSRLHRNANYFQLNYSLLMPIILYCTLIFHPLFIIIFLLIFGLWMFLVFFRETPVVVFGGVVSDAAVMGVLGVFMVVGLVFTGMGSVVFGALVFGVVVVGLHWVVRSVEDLVMVVGLAFTTMGSVVFGALVIGVVVVGLHGVVRSVDDLFLDENEAAEGGLLSVVGRP